MGNFPNSSSVINEENNNFYYATQWSLIRLRFRQHRLASISLIFLCLLYLFAIFSDFLVPYSSTQRFSKYNFSAPTSIHIYDSEACFSSPFVYGQKKYWTKKHFPGNTNLIWPRKSTFNFSQREKSIAYLASSKVTSIFLE